jgi:hypothetical protein
MNINVMNKREIENIIDRKIMTSLGEINRQLDYLYQKIDSIEENVTALEIYNKNEKG